MKNGLKIVSGLVSFILLLSLVYVCGPMPEKLELEANAYKLMQPTHTQNYVEEVVAKREESLNIRTGNESQIFWADSATKKTKYVLLYLHGFSASPEEGAPIHLEFAKRYGMNMYAPLLAEHGLVEDEKMLRFTAATFLESAKNALRLAQLMGDSVIVMATSTGCTASLFLASGQNNIHSLICYSPNIRVYDQRASLLTGPWGLKIARLVKGGKNHTWIASEQAANYWHLTYRLEAVIEMQRLLETTMVSETFNNIVAPTFVAYYYNNENEQDDVVSVPAILDMCEQLGSRQIMQVAMPTVGAHALASKYFSKDMDAVKRQTFDFAERILQLQKI